MPHPLTTSTRGAGVARLAALLSLAASCRSPVTAPETQLPRTTTGTARLLPAPTSLVVASGAPFVFTADTRLVADPGEPEQVAQSLATVLRPSTGYPLAVSAAAPTPAGIVRLAVGGDRTALGDEGYELRVTSDSVLITAPTGAGLFHGAQTLRQLLPAEIESHYTLRRHVWSVPALVVRDVPRFAWRGAMLDVARHFFTVKEVKEYVDILALYKMNVLHLHLSDDQGWRIEIKSRPKLTQVGGATQVGGGPGGYFTQDDYADLVRYAQARYVTIVPEIDMPGHSNAALTAYPELSCGTRPPGLYSGTEVGWSTLCVDREDTYALIDDVVREIAAMTPGAYLHVGGDEVQALTPAQYTTFVSRVQGIVEQHGKRAIGWEEITKAPLHPSTIAQLWRSDSLREAVQAGTRLLLSPGKKLYIDMKYDSTTELGLQWAGFVPVRATYEWDPATFLPGATESQIVGVEAPIWSETVRNISAVESLAMPRLPAAAEVGWTAQSAREWGSFRVRLAAQAPRWRFLGINYYRAPDVPW